MKRRLVFRSVAERDVVEAIERYEGERAGLGARFLTQLDALLERIGQHPRQFPEIESGVHRGLVNRFPYGVYFTQGQEEIVVLAVLHLHRHPDTWKDR